MPALTNAVQDVPIGPVEVDYRHHQHQGSIGEQLEGGNTSKHVNVKVNLLKYDNNLLIFNFPFQEEQQQPRSNHERRFHRNC